MHVTHEGVHLLEGLGRRLDDDVDALAELVELEVGDERRHLDQCVGAQREARHLAVDPDDPVRHGPVVGVAHRSTIKAAGAGIGGAAPTRHRCTSLRA